MQPPNSSCNPPDPLANPALAGMTKISLANRYFHHYSAPDRRAEYCDERVSVCVCVLLVRGHISGTARPIFTYFCACYLWPWPGHPLPAQ